MRNRASKVDKLPPEIRAQIAGLRDDGHSLDEIMQHLGRLSLDPDDMPSRSGLGRHVQGLDTLANIINQQRRTAEVLARSAADPGAPDASLAMNTALLHGLMTRLIANVGGNEDATLTAKEIALLCTAVRSLTVAGRADVVTKMAVRKEMAAEMAKQVDAIEEDAEKAPMTPAQILERVRAVYRGEG